MVYATSSALLKLVEDVVGKQVFIKPAGFTTEIENIAQGVFLDNGFTFNFAKNKTAWLYNETQVQAVLTDPAKYKRIGTLENVHYNSPDNIAGKGDVQFYSEVGNARIVAFKRINTAGSLDGLVSWTNKNGLSHLTQAEIKATFDLFDGNITFAQKALLSSKEIVAGKTLPELAQHFSLPTIPSAQSLTPYQARVWYSWRKSQISTLVNRSNGLEAAVREAVELRNTIRTTTRTSMKDVDIADFLNTKEVNMTWDDTFLKYNGEYEKIIDASMRGRGVVDVLFQIPK